MRTIGDRDGLQFEISLPGEVSEESATRRTRGRLRLRVRGRSVWGDETGFEWTWVELLEWLGEAWAWLRWEDSLPFGLEVGPPSQVWTDAERRWRDMPQERREQEADLLDAFVELHDLARGVQGAFLAPVWLVGEGRLMSVCTDERTVQLEREAVLATLLELGDTLADQLEGIEDSRASAALAQWGTREDLNGDALVEIATGLDSETRDWLEGNRSPEDVWEFPDVGFEPTELMAAARMTAAQPKEIIRNLLAEIVEIPGCPTDQIDSLSEQAAAVLDEMEDGAAPYEEGHRLAAWLRDQIDAGLEGSVVPHELLGEWGVELRQIDLEVSDIDAFAAWGPRHGPGVVLNTSGKHNTTIGGRNATLAHEIAHLLVDRRRALPLVEVMSARAPARPESRARAFAAELLLPRSVAGREMAAGQEDPEGAARRLGRRYGVSMEVIAWQARNSGINLPESVWTYLRKRVSRPDLF